VSCVGVKLCVISVLADVEITASTCATVVSYTVRCILAILNLPLKHALTNQLDI